MRDSQGVKAASCFHSSYRMGMKAKWGGQNECAGKPLLLHALIVHEELPFLSLWSHIQVANVETCTSWHIKWVMIGLITTTLKALAKSDCDGNFSTANL